MNPEQVKSLQEEQLRKVWDNGRFAEANTGDLQNPRYNDNVEKMWSIFYLSVASQFQRPIIENLQEEIEKEAEKYAKNTNQFAPQQIKLTKNDFSAGATWMSHSDSYRNQRQEAEGWVKLPELPKEKEKLCLFIQLQSDGKDTINEYIGTLENAQYFRRYEMANDFTHWKYLELPSPPETK